MRRALVAVIFIVLALGASSRASVRVALLASADSKPLANVLSLAEVKLSQNDQLELLERNSIVKVLAEQKISLSGMVSADQAVAAGKLLRVEIFAFVESLGDDSPPTLVVFDAFNGARLTDIDLPNSTAEAQAAAIANGVDHARLKLVTPVHAKTICLLAVRNADLPRAMDSVCNAVAGLLERRLLASDDVRLLERKRLEGINKERQLGTLDPKHDILASLVTVDLEFSRSKDPNSLIVTALLSDATGKPLTDSQHNPLTNPQVPVDPSNISAAAETLSAKISDALSITPGTVALDPANESKRFAAEARFLYAHAQVADALAAAESAYTLNANGFGTGRILSDALLRRAWEMIHRKEGDDVRAFNMAARSFDVRDNWLGALRRDHPTAEEVTVYADNITGDRFIDLMKYALAAPARNDPEITDAAQRLGSAYIHFTHDLLVSSEAACAGNANALHNHMEHARINHIVPAMALAAQTKTQYVDEVCGMYERYFALLSALEPATALPLYIDAARYLGDVKEHWRCDARDWAAADFSVADRERIERLFATLTQSISPVVRFYGLWDRIHFVDAAHSLSPPQFDALLADTTQTARKAVDDPVLMVADRNGFYQNELWMNALSIPPLRMARDVRLTQLVDWFNFILQRKQLPQAAIVKLPELQFLKADGGQIVDLLTRFNAMANDPACKFIGCTRDEGRTLLAAKIHYFAKNYPQVKTAFVGTGEDVRILLHIGGPIVAVDYCVADAAGVCAIVTADQNGKVVTQAMSVPIDGNGPRVVGTIEDNVGVSDIATSESWIAAGTKHGIFLYPRNGSAPTIISSRDGLPTDDVESLALLDDRIYAGLGDRGYFVSYDLQTHHCDVLASSRRKQKASPFDDTATFSILRVIADEPKHRVLLVHCRSGSFTENGLWQFDPKSASFTQLFNCYFKYRDKDASHLLPGNKIVVNTNHWAVSFDAGDDSTRVLFSDHEGAGPRLRTEPRPFAWNQQLEPPFTLVGSDLWAGNPLTRVRADSGEIDPIDLPADQQVRGRAPTPTSRLRPTTSVAWRLNAAEKSHCEWVIPLAEGKHVVAGNARGLWLVPMSSTAIGSTQPVAATQK